MADDHLRSAPEETASSGLIEGFVCAADGKVSPAADLGKAAPPEGGFVWLHLNVLEAEPLLEDQLGLDPVVTRALLAAETRPRCQFLRGGVLINLRGINLNKGQRPEDMLSVRCFMEEGRLITVRLQRSVAIEELREAYRSGRGHETPAELLTELIRRLLHLIDPVVDGLADGLDHFEARAAKPGRQPELKNDVSAMRHDAVIYRRYLAPMRDAIAKLAARKTDRVSPRITEELLEEADRATRIVEELDITIDRASVIVDQMMAARDARMNRNMMVLSVVSAIFLPLSFLTGLLGINVGGLPGTDDPRAFGIVTGLCLLIGCAFAAWFKARDWI